MLQKDRTIAKILEEIAEEEGVSVEDVRKYINEIFRLFKQKTKLKAIPEIKMGGYLLIMPNLVELKTRILTWSTDLYIPLNRKIVEATEIIVERIKYFKSNASPVKKSQMAKKWKKQYELEMEKGKGEVFRIYQKNQKKSKK